MKKILILSDTHGYIDERIKDYARESDEIWHAGDWGTEEVFLELEKLAPVKTVFGNIDGHEIRKYMPEWVLFMKQGVKIGMLHIAGNPKRLKPKAEILVKEKPDLLICGHSHILRVEKINAKTLYLNPGAAGNYGMHNMRTMIRLKVDNGRIFDVEVIELGKRGLIGNEDEEI